MSSGPSSPTSQTVTQTTIPEYLRPHVETMVGQAAGLMQGELDRGYQPFQGQRIAGFSPMQAQAFEQVAGMQVAPQIADASNLALGSGQSALGFGQQGAQYGAMGTQFGQQGAGFGALGTAIGGQGIDVGRQGMLGAQQAAAQTGGLAGLYGAMGAGTGAQFGQIATDPSQVQAFMSPYMQNVVDVQQREARRAADIQRQANQAQAVQQGAFGGSRQAVVEAELQRNLGQQLGDIQSMGLQKAFEDARQAQMFGADLGLRGVQTGLQGVGQQIAAGQLGLAGAETGLRGVGMGIEGARTGIEGARTGIQGAQTGISGAQTGIQGAQTGISAAGQMGQLGAEQFRQQMGISDAMQKYGALQQAQQQAALDVDFQNYLAAQNFPYQQLGFFSDIVRGLPMSQGATTVYGGQPSVAAQVPGALMAAYGMFGRGNKEGGQIKSYAEGGAVSPEGMNIENVMSLRGKLRRLSDPQLAAYARTVKDAITLSALQTEIDRRAKLRQPYAQAPQSTTADEIAQRAEAASLGGPVTMAGGGIVALQAGGAPGTQMTEDEALAQAGILGPIVGAQRQAGRFIDWIQEQRRRDAALRQQFAQSQMGLPITPIPESAPADTPVDKPPTAPAQPPGPPQQFPPGTRDLRAPVVIGPQGLPIAVDEQGNELLASPEAPPAPPAAPPSATAPQGAPSGIMGASASGRSQMPSTFDQFREMSRQVEPNPEDQAVLADMRRRVDDRMSRAEEQGDTAKYDAILMAGLAMMGGNSLADGIARAAQTGGATYMASRQEARKALDAAEDAELAFNQYQIALRKGDEKAARDEFKNYTDYVLKLQEIDATYARTSAMSADTQANRALGRISQLEGAIGRAKKEVEDQPKYKIPLDALRARMRDGSLTEQEQARYDSLIADINEEAEERTKNLRLQLNSMYDRLAGTESIDGFAVRRPETQ